MISTSNFVRSGSLPGSISIARRAPEWFHGLSYLPLAPTREMLHNPDIYDREYDHILAALDPRQVVRDLEDVVSGPRVILLCWEGLGVRCHRRSVAEWFEQKLGIEVPELNQPRNQTLPYISMPRKDRSPTRPGKTVSQIDLF
jgi:hypothetical protein